MGNLSGRRKIIHDDRDMGLCKWRTPKNDNHIGKYITFSFNCLNFLKRECTKKHTHQQH